MRPGPTVLAGRSATRRALVASVVVAGLVAGGGGAGATDLAATGSPPASIDRGTVVGVSTLIGDAVGATLDERGGTLTTTSGPITYTLTVPADALLSPTTITMTPISPISGSPLEEPSAAGVVFGPDGLLLAAPAKLTITGGPSTVGSVGFGFGGAGEDFHLVPFVPGAGVVLPVRHFSGVGYGAASPAIVARIAAAHVVDSLDAIAQAQAAYFSAHPDDPNGLLRLEEYGIEAQQVAEQGIMAALDDPLDLGAAAIVQWLAAEASLQLIGSGIDRDISVVTKLLDRLDAELDRMCTEGSADPMATTIGILVVARMRALVFGYGAGTDARDGAAFDARLHACEVTLSVKPTISWLGVNVASMQDAPIHDSMILAGPLLQLSLQLSPKTRTPLGTRPTGRRYRWQVDVPLTISDFTTDNECWTGAAPVIHTGFEPTLHIEVAPDLNVTRPIGVPDKRAGAPPPAISAAVKMNLRGGVAYTLFPDPPHRTCDPYNRPIALFLDTSWAAVDGSAPDRVLFGGGAIGWSRTSPPGSTQSGSRIGYYTITTDVAYSVSK